MFLIIYNLIDLMNAFEDKTQIEEKKAALKYLEEA